MFRCDLCGHEREDELVDLTDEQSLVLSGLSVVSGPPRQICHTCVRQLANSIVEAFEPFRQAILEVGEVLYRWAARPEVQRVCQDLKRLEHHNKEDRK